MLSRRPSTSCPGQPTRTTPVQQSATHIPSHPIPSHPSTCGVQLSCNYYMIHTHTFIRSLSILASSALHSWSNLYTPLRDKYMHSSFTVCPSPPLHCSPFSSSCTPHLPSPHLHIGPCSINEEHLPCSMEQVKAYPVREECGRALCNAHTTPHNTNHHSICRGSYTCTHTTECATSSPDGCLLLRHCSTSNLQ